jgi:tocopherol cyclase
MRLYHPEVFQGSLKNRHYFEGWYFKSVDAQEQNVFAVIPGVSLGEDSSHSFIQFLDGPGKKSYYFKYSLNDFWSSKKRFEIKISKSYFSLRKLQLNIEDSRAKIKAELEFRNIYQWPVTLLSPGVMGWYRFVPKMECYHGILSFNHEINGYFEINGERKDFTGGRGYCEKDWGTSMPSSWIWLQTNNFDEIDVSLFGSIAKIPWRGSFFTGYIFGFFYKKKIYRFATYTGAKISKLYVDNEQIAVIVGDKKYSLEITAKREPGFNLAVPVSGAMSSKVNEALKAKIFVKFTEKKSNVVIFSGTGRNSGLEFVGDIKELLRGIGK